MRNTLIALAALSLTAPALAQDNTILTFSGLEWSVAGTPLEATYREREALRLHQAGLELTGADYDDFVVEYDLAMEAGQGFNGVYFRQNGQDADQIYFRHHLSGQPDSAQYTPVFDGLSAWQIYTSPGFWQAIDFPIGEWTRVRIVVDGDQAQVSLDGIPVFDIPDLLGRHDTGGFSIRSFGQTGAWISDLSIRPLTEDDRLGPMQTAELPEIDGQLIETWLVSPAFDEALINSASTLPEGLPDARTSLTAAYHGIANLGSVVARTSEANTVLAEARISSDRDQVVMLNFGYSDRVRVFLNGELLFSGSNMWRSRDYRYLGTISRDYAVPLRLQAGENVLTMAVSESFGGWGVTGVLEASTGVNTAP